jgi:hypothetical protein
MYVTADTDAQPAANDQNDDLWKAARPSNRLKGRGFSQPDYWPLDFNCFSMAETISFESGVTAGSNR